MYKIEKTSYGTCVTFSGIVTEEEMRRFKAESELIPAGTSGPRAAMADIRDLLPPDQIVRDLLIEALRGAWTTGLLRVAVIGKSPVIKRQTIQLVFQAGGVDTMRYFDASKLPDWEKHALDWLIHGVEPEDTTNPGTARIQIG